MRPAGSARDNGSTRRAKSVDGRAKPEQDEGPGRTGKEAYPHLTSIVPDCAPYLLFHLCRTRL
jgi:hypothetical protein